MVNPIQKRKAFVVEVAQSRRVRIEENGLVKEANKDVLTYLSTSIKEEDTAPPKEVENDRKVVLMQISVGNVVEGKKTV